jgi:phosphatidylserine decarboxylase
MIKRDIGLALQYGLPHRLLSRMMFYLMRSQWGWVKNTLIQQIAKRYRVDMSDALEPDLAAYPSFNAFFTRALKPGARPIAAGANALICPADGAISQAGNISEGRILQAKGMDYSCGELLGDEALAEGFSEGSFATVYLSPRDYHRVHMPVSGKLIRTLHVPGRLFSVATWTAESIPRLFARNERLVCVFDTDQGQVALVLVGAIFVSSMDTVWSGTVTPPYAPRIIDQAINDGPTFAAGAEMGRFNMGSTAIIVTQKRVQFDADIAAQLPVKMGRALGFFESEA